MIVPRASCEVLLVALASYVQISHLLVKAGFFAERTAKLLNSKTCSVAIISDLI